ncbi:MAG: hypothetical protein ACTSQI_22570 [Candidatus Helarchaeota archaeon]
MSSFAPGFVVPMPTLPFISILIRSAKELAPVLCPKTIAGV